jgi:hypothetical protein
MLVFSGAPAPSDYFEDLTSQAGHQNRTARAMTLHESQSQIQSLYYEELSNRFQYECAERCLSLQSNGTPGTDFIKEVLHCLAGTLDDHKVRMEARSSVWDDEQQCFLPLDNQRREQLHRDLTDYLQPALMQALGAAAAAACEDKQYGRSLLSSRRTKLEGACIELLHRKTLATEDFETMSEAAAEEQLSFPPSSFVSLAEELRSNTSWPSTVSLNPSCQTSSLPRISKKKVKRLFFPGRVSRTFSKVREELRRDLHLCMTNGKKNFKELSHDLYPGSWRAALYGQCREELQREMTDQWPALVQALGTVAAAEYDLSPVSFSGDHWAKFEMHECRTTAVPDLEVMSGTVAEEEQSLQASPLVSLDAELCSNASWSTISLTSNCQISALPGKMPKKSRRRSLSGGVAETLRKARCLPKTLTFVALHGFSGM